MVGEQLGVVGRAAEGLDPLRRLGMSLSARATRDLAVGDVAHKNVPEGELRLGGNRRAPFSAHELLTLERVESGFDLLALAPAHLSQCAAPEHLADDRGVLQELLLIAGEPVQPSGDNPLHALRHVVEHAALREEPGELLGVERIPLGSVEHGRPDANGDHGTFDEARDETARFLLGQRRKTDRQRIRLATAPARPP